ncbi:hypothetical protein [Sulfuriflexus mobilis]|uniref:hypothetical protein n=1 Tax=Sulfuriflexus mobilis TaxID=1811807 RepID=UPI000F839975|nr:hypothetical protein [Sulfuriflexus mobilis]
MQLGLVSTPAYRLLQRVAPVEEIVGRPSPADSHRRQADDQRPQPLRLPTTTESENARRHYDYSRIEAVPGRTAQALREYTEIADGPEREQLQAQLGLDMFV